MFPIKPQQSFQQEGAHVHSRPINNRGYQVCAAAVATAVSSHVWQLCAAAFFVKRVAWFAMIPPHVPRVAAKPVRISNTKPESVPVVRSWNRGDIERVDNAWLLKDFGMTPWWGSQEIVPSNIKPAPSLSHLRSNQHFDYQEDEIFLDYRRCGKIDEDQDRKSVPTRVIRRRRALGTETKNLGREEEEEEDENVGGDENKATQSTIT
ncbi:hypothetical protein EG329_004018 [Mollisiaceae sp. DMI_Dod_QoI]|nr:hypothetical protein EG329_004018 [Helotiales sp. DMI_Dod_QoI]